MSIVNLHQIKKAYGLNQVLDGFSMNINDGEKMALIGANGSGKTTILRLITGQEKVDSGAVSIRNGISIGHLNQIPDYDEQNTLKQELREVFSDIIFMEKEMKALEEKISTCGQKKESAKLEGLMREYSNLQEKFAEKGGYGFESRLERTAVGLGFLHRELEKKVTTLSGGEKTRLGLVKLLLEEPDLLLLDEPTNHLDISSTHWLENYLQKYEGTAVIISHDRYFLDAVVDRIVEVKRGQAEQYAGNYSYYLEERERRYEQRLRAYKNQQKKIKEMEEAIERLRVWGRQSDNAKFFSRAKSMEKRLQKMEKLPRPILREDKIGLEFSIKRRSGDEVVQVEDVHKSFGETGVLNGIDLQVYWSEKNAIIGGNGTGKTTLLQIITGELEPDKGMVQIGASVKPGYYSQEFDEFNPEDDVLTAFLREVPLTKKKARNILASFHFQGQDVFEKVAHLSGGEKSKLRLLQLMVGNYNLLLLDEPTNHLDLPSREKLEEALQEYPGTVILVSHDRYFLNKIAEYTYELEEGTLTKYYGNYDYYRQKREKRRGERAQNQQSGESNKETSSAKNEYQKMKEERNRRQRKKRKIEELQEEIILKEEKMETLEEQMAAPENLQDHEFLLELKQEYNVISEKVSELYKQWECLTAERETEREKEV